MVRSSGLAVATESRLIAGRYRVEALLGKGGMGAVYAAVDSSTGRRLALKTTAHSQSPKVLELFKREFHTLHGLRHPNIIEVYDYGSDADGLFYTMELLEGGDLAHAAPLPWRQVCSYLRQVATLLGLLHARRLLHRDVTPRNLWLLPDGRLKMIDFGALCPFGVPTEIVGTPPFIAPEWLFDRAADVRVDQRSDLYALGALAYWLLTSAHAYPARAMNELPRVWAREPAPPSSLAKLIESRSLESIPAELDALVLSLLRREPAARPETTETLIDRIDAIAGPPPDAVDHAVHGYVRSKAFVGRKSEQRCISERLQQRGEGDAVVVQAAAGLGRSRLLEELSLLGRLSGATSVLVRADPQEQAYGVANRIALGLLNGVPQEALASVHERANVLAQLSPEVQQRLGVVETIVRDETPNGRSQLQSALTEWLFALAAQKRLMLSVDDIEQADEESAAWLAALAPYCSANRILLVVAMVDNPGVQPALPLQMLRDAATCLTLSPLMATEMHELLHSVFGPAGYLERVSDSLYRASQGSPAHCLELVEHLVETGLARYSEGTWTLPGHLSDDELPRNRSQMYLARLEQLGVQARSLAELMSIHDGRLRQRDCQALSQASEQDTAAALVELKLLGVLIESDQGYMFAHASVREHLAKALVLERRTRAHAQLGASLLAAAKEPIDAMRAGLHLFCAGDTRRCEQLVHAAAMHLLEGNRAREHAAVPLFEQAVALYHAAGHGPERLASPLAALATASFFVDRRLADRYGMAAIEALEHVLRFDVARNLRRYVGAKLALFAALLVAAIQSAKGGVSVGDALKMLASAAVALNGVACSSIDIATTERCKLALEPLAALGERNIVGLVRMCVAAVSGLLTEEHTEALERLQTMRKLLESDAPIRHLNDAMRREFLGGGLLSIGILQGWKQSSGTLAIADRIESFGPLYALNADQLRAVYYSGRGDTARALRYQQRVETRALQVGAAWQIVAIGPIGASLSALWNYDALLAKRAAAELDRLSRELPTFRHEARHARATYLLLTGRYPEVIELMRASDHASKTAGWCRGQGILARAHNRVGEHERARELCQAALEGKSEGDLEFVLMNLHVQIEWVLAEAALGNFEVARARSERLLARHSGIGPIAVGALHEARARVALLERDFVLCHEHCDAMRRQFASTDIVSLHELSERLIRRVAVAERGEEAAVASPATLLGDDEHLMTRMRLILTHTEHTFERRAQLGLQMALELTGAQQGFVISRAADGGVVGTDGRIPDPELVSWAISQLQVDTDEQTAVLETVQSMADTSLLTLGELRYCVSPLGALDNNATHAPFALVLGFLRLAPRAPSAEVLAILARHLVEQSVP